MRTSTSPTFGLVGTKDVERRVERIPALGLGGGHESLAGFLGLLGLQPESLLHSAGLDEPWLHQHLTQLGAVGAHPVVDLVGQNRFVSAVEVDGARLGVLGLLLVGLPVED